MISLTDGHVRAIFLLVIFTLILVSDGACEKYWDNGNEDRDVHGQNNGEWCDFDEMCTGQLHCDRSEEGFSYKTNKNSTEEKCKWSGKCRFGEQSRRVGESCVLNKECYSTYCLEKICRNWPKNSRKVGESCTLNMECKTESCIHNACQKFQSDSRGIGETCTIGDECKTKICTFGACHPAYLKTPISAMIIFGMIILIGWYLKYFVENYERIEFSELELT